MNEIEWIEIPAGDFLYGLSPIQIKDIRENLWQGDGVASMDEDEQRILKALIQSLRKVAQEQLHFGRSQEWDKIPIEQRNLFRKWAADSRQGYLQAEQVLEKVTAMGSKWLPRFYIAKYPITHTQADAFFKSTVGARLFRTGQLVDQTLPDMPEDLTFPVADAMAKWFGGRLPTVYEWEKAARGTDGRLYPWGNDWQPWSGNFGNQYLVESSRHLGTRVTVVDAYPSGVSPYGVCDMLGNLEEWTASEHRNSRSSDEMVYVTKGAGTKNLDEPTWFWTISALDGVGYPSKWHVCVRPVKDMLE